MPILTFAQCYYDVCSTFEVLISMIILLHVVVGYIRFVCFV